MTLFSSVSDCEYNRKSSFERPDLLPVQVILRIKPLLQNEALVGGGCVTVHDCETVSIRKGQKAPAFTFDRVFRGDRNEEEQVFVDMIEPLIEDCCSNSISSNATIILYGESGSGKTTCLTSKNNGLIPRALVRMFRMLGFKQAKEEREMEYSYDVSVQLVEVLNKELNDLLLDTSKSTRSDLWELRPSNSNDSSRLTLRGLGTDSPQIVGVSSQTVTSVEDAMMLLELGLKRRWTADTSHIVLTLEITQRYSHLEYKSLFNFVELAAPQHQVGLLPRNDEFRERCDINKALMVLGIILVALWTEFKNRFIKKSKDFFPYRDSLLTSVLKGSLTGQNKTILIACISSAQEQYEKSVDTLRFASRIKKIQTKPSVMDTLESMDNLVDEDSAYASAAPAISVVSADLSNFSRNTSSNRLLETKKSSAMKVRTDNLKLIARAPRHSEPIARKESPQMHRVVRETNKTIQSSNSYEASATLLRKFKKSEPRTTTPVKAPIQKYATQHRAVSLMPKVASLSTVVNKENTVSITEQSGFNEDHTEMSDLLDALLDPVDHRSITDPQEMSDLLDALLDTCDGSVQSKHSEAPALKDDGLVVVSTEQQSNGPVDRLVDASDAVDEITGEDSPEDLVGQDNMEFTASSLKRTDDAFLPAIISETGDIALTEIPCKEAEQLTESREPQKEEFENSSSTPEEIDQDKMKDLTQIGTGAELFSDNVIVVKDEVQVDDNDLDADDLLAELLDDSVCSVKSDFDEMTEDRNNDLNIETMDETPENQDLKACENADCEADQEIGQGDTHDQKEDPVMIAFKDPVTVDDFVAEMLDDSKATSPNNRKDNPVLEIVQVEKLRERETDADVTTADGDAGLKEHSMDGDHYVIENDVSYDAKNSTRDESGLAVSNADPNSYIEPVEPCHSFASIGSSCGDPELNQHPELSNPSSEQVGISLDSSSPSEPIFSISTVPSSSIEPVEPCRNFELNEVACEPKPELNQLSDAATPESNQHEKHNDSALESGLHFASNTTLSRYPDSRLLNKQSKFGERPVFHIGDIEDPGLDSRLSRKNMLLTRKALRDAVEKSNFSVNSSCGPLIVDIPPLPMNHEDLQRVLKSSGLFLNENADFALPSLAFSKEELSALSEEDLARHESNNLYRLIGFWECGWKNRKERALIRKLFLQTYSYCGVDAFDYEGIHDNGEAAVTVYRNPVDEQAEELAHLSSELPTETISVIEPISNVAVEVNSSDSIGERTNVAEPKEPIDASGPGVVCVDKAGDSENAVTNDGNGAAVQVEARPSTASSSFYPPNDDWNSEIIVEDYELPEEHIVFEGETSVYDVESTIAANLMHAGVTSDESRSLVEPKPENGIPQESRLHDMDMKSSENTSRSSKSSKSSKRKKSKKMKEKEGTKSSSSSARIVEETAAGGSNGKETIKAVTENLEAVCLPGHTSENKIHNGDSRPVRDDLEKSLLELERQRKKESKGKKQSAATVDEQAAVTNRTNESKGKKLPTAAVDEHVVDTKQKNESKGKKQSSSDERDQIKKRTNQTSKMEMPPESSRNTPVTKPEESAEKKSTLEMIERKPSKKLGTFFKGLFKSRKDDKQGTDDDSATIQY